MNQIENGKKHENWLQFTVISGCMYASFLFLRSPFFVLHFMLCRQCSVAGPGLWGTEEKMTNMSVWEKGMLSIFLLRFLGAKIPYEPVLLHSLTYSVNMSVSHSLTQGCNGF